MEEKFYIVGCSQESDGGIYLYRRENGRSRLENFTPVAGANYLAFAGDRRTVYASGADAERNGYVAAFRVETDGVLSFLNKVPTDGTACCHLCVSPDGRRLYAANYLSGSVAGFALEPDGRLGDLREFDQHRGHGVDTKRQEGPHAHFTGFSPDGRFLLVNDLGLDLVFAYPYDMEHGIDCVGAVKNPVVPEGSGPRHLLFEPEGTCLLVTEMGNAIQRFACADGVLTLRESVSTLLEGTAIPSKAAAIRLSPDGKFVLASNRGLDSTAVFERRTLKRVFLGFCGGKSPRDFDFLADGRTVVVTNEFEPNVVVFDFDAQNGTLTPTGEVLALPRPLCVMRTSK